MATVAADDKPHECKHIAFMSSQVLNGEGYGIVIRCGDNSFIGKINSLAAGTKGTVTTLQRDINLFVKFIALIAVTMAIVLFSAGLGRGMPFAEAFVNGIVVVLVANIPQGLPATVTSALTLTAERMKDVSVLVKRTDIIESLGSATRIASDKTGTLTQNKMTVMNCWVNRQYKSASEIVSTVHRPGRTNAGASAGLSKAKQASMGRASVSRGAGSTSAGRAHVANLGDIETALPPAAGRPGEVPRTRSRTTSLYGTDMASRMSMGKNSVGQAVRPARTRRGRMRLCVPPRADTTACMQGVGASMGRNSVMTFALNVTTAPPDDPAGGTLWDQFSPLSKLITIAAVNNKAQFEGSSEEKPGAVGDERRVLGDATDSGLMRFCDKVMTVTEVRDAFASVFSVPFNSKNKWALNMTRIPGDAEHYIVMIKGAPEYVIKKCGRYFYRNREHVMDEDFAEDMLEAYQSFGTLAERVIGHAFKVRPPPRCRTPRRRWHARPSAPLLQRGR